MMNVRPVVIPLDHEFKFDFELVRRSITSKTKVAVLVNPGNPTGMVHNKKELQAFVNLCASHNITIIADETYEYFVYDVNPHIPLATLGYENIIGLGSFSKTFGIPGWRLGYYYGSQSIISASIKIQDTIGICAPHPTQVLGKILIQNRKDLIPPVVNQMKRNHELVSRLIHEVPWLESTPSQGAYYLFPKQTTGKDTTQLVRQLISKGGVHILPGVGFGNTWQDYCRLSFANVGPEELIEAFSRLSSFKP